MSNDFLNVISQLNALLRDVALDCPEYYNRCLNIMRLLRSEIDKENEYQQNVNNLIINQHGNERSN